MKETGEGGYRGGKRGRGKRGENRNLSLSSTHTSVSPHLHRVGGVCFSVGGRRAAVCRLRHDCLATALCFGSSCLLGFLCLAGGSGTSRKERDGEVGMRGGRAGGEPGQSWASPKTFRTNLQHVVEGAVICCCHHGPCCSLPRRPSSHLLPLQLLRLHHLRLSPPRQPAPLMLPLGCPAPE